VCSSDLGSVIPSGALHKNKHNLEQINLELDGEITKKGIPVISYAKEGEVLEYEADGKTPKIFAEGGEVIQHAEIEKEEVILNLSLTKKLIELMKKNDTESQIEAGRILSIELIENTQDNSGIIEKILENEN
jgi:wobble nucleotide-excising tRNase